MPIIQVHQPSHCPYCGTKPITRQLDNGSIVYCEQCKLSVSSHNIENDINDNIRLWNELVMGLNKENDKQLD